MKATIFTAPKSIKVPALDFRNMSKYREDEKKYISDLSEFCKKRKTGEHIGKVIKIPHADGYAMYMVASMKPVELIHIPLGDAWDSEFADLLTADKIKEMIKSEEVLAKLFGNK